MDPRISVAGERRTDRVLKRRHQTKTNMSRPSVKNDTAPEEESADDNATSAIYVTTGGPRTLSSTPRAILRSRIPESVDVFGFSIPPGQFLLIQLAATLMLGVNGSLVFLIALLAYTLFNRVTSRRNTSPQQSGTNNRRPGTSNIRGMKDLPKPPPKGG